MIGSARSPGDKWFEVDFNEAYLLPTETLRDYKFPL